MKPTRLIPTLTAAVALTLAPAFLTPARAQPAAGPNGEPPKSWIDPDTGHRVIRLTNEPGSDSFYFNYNGYTPDGKVMAYSTPEGISVLNLETHEARQIVKGPARAIIVGHKTPTIFYTRPGIDHQQETIWSTNIDTGETHRLAQLPPRANVGSINADETLAAGVFIEGNANAGGAYDGTAATGRMGDKNLGEPVNKGEMMIRRLKAKLPVTLFTIDLRDGKVTPLIEHSTDWLNHVQFSPADPALLMYCHEGPWQLVDRIWTIRTDGTHNELVHKRTMKMEIAGHEWWGADGKTIYYQLHFPRGGRTSFIASFNVQTGERTWLEYSPQAQSSIHDNSSPDQKLFCGDGDRQSPWIFLFHPVLVQDRGTIGKDLIQGGYLDSEKLVNMSKHNYRLEPNPSFTPDMKYIVFRSNMFGPDYAFAVEIAKAK